MSNTYKAIDEFLNTSFIKQDQESIIPKKNPVAAVVAVQKEYGLVVSKTKEEINSNFAEDYDFIRETLKELIGSGKEALDTATSLAVDTESPRAFEVCTTIMTTIVTLGKELTNLHKEALKISSSDIPKLEIPTGSTITQNNYYPTPKEIQSILDTVTEVIYDDADLE